MRVHECECGNLTVNVGRCDDCHEAHRKVNVKAIRARRAAMRADDPFQRPARVRR